MDFLPRPDFQCQWHHPNSAIAPISPRSTINSSDEHQNKNFALPLTALFLFRASSVTFYDTNSNTFKILISNTLLYVLVQPEPPLDFNVTWHNYSATFCSFLDQFLSSFYWYILSLSFSFYQRLFQSVSISFVSGNDATVAKNIIARVVWSRGLWGGLRCPRCLLKEMNRHLKINC